LSQHTITGSMPKVQQLATSSLAKKSLQNKEERWPAIFAHRFEHFDFLQVDDQSE
jgi:hypothetical protein